MTGSLRIVGLGPGDPGLRAPQADAVLADATDLIGYGPYLDRVAARPDQHRHPSDNREELDRARHALDLARSGRRVAVVSSGDPGVFAMAAAVFEAIEADAPDWDALDVGVVPGISAVLATAARLGAPLGGDFCVMSLSDNLKPWETIVARLDAAARAGFVTALYNPISRARPWQLGAAFELLRRHLPGRTPVAFATAISRPEERLHLTSLAEADPTRADMRTLVIVGSAESRFIAGPRGSRFYTPRSVRAS